jgi:hypothetical protein
MITVAMDVPVRCTGCTGDVSCRTCNGTRTVYERFSAWLALRPGTGDGTVLDPSVQLPGVIEPVKFRVRFA